MVVCSPAPSDMCGRRTLTDMVATRRTTNRAYTARQDRLRGKIPKYKRQPAGKLYTGGETAGSKKSTNVYHTIIERRLLNKNRFPSSRKLSKITGILNTSVMPMGSPHDG